MPPKEDASTRYNPVQVESEIPDELKETPPLETTGMLDKRFDDLISEINFIHESRGKDFQNIDSRKDKLPAVETITYYERYREFRQARIDSVAKVDLPIRPQSSSGKIRKEIENYWNINEEVNGKTLLPKLREFYLNKSFELLEESALLLSRWQRFCKTTYDVMTHSPAFIRHFTVLRAEFADSTCRLTRLSESMDEKLKVIKAQEAAEDAARNEAERKGIFTNKGGRGQTSIQVTNVNTLAMEALKLQKANIKEAMEQADMEMKEIMRKHRQSEDETEIPTDIEDCGFDVADLIIYLRSMISNFKSRREIETFLTRAKAMLHGDRVTLLREYKLISSLTPGSHLLDILDDYDGVNLFMDCPPIKTPKVEDFLTEFDILCAHYRIETNMMQEDGRPFSFEVDGKFTFKFFIQVLETNYISYDASESELQKISNPSNVYASERSSGPGGLDTKAATVANAIATLTASSIKLPDAPRIKAADWLNDPTLVPQNEESLEHQIDTLRQHKDIDFELMCEMDLIRCNDMDTVLHRLKENARRVWEVCAKKSNSKPLIAKSSVLSKPGTRAIAVPEINIDQPRLPETFDLSMMIPDGRDHLSDFQVLDGKKHIYGLILKNNEDLRIAEQDLPASERSTNLMIDPTVATIFAEHEVNSYLLLRFCKIRELRNTLRLQLNYFRSIEKRINLDVRQSKLRHKLSPLEASSFKPSYQNISSTFKNNNASFDTEDYGSNKQESPDSKAPNVIFSNPRLAENMATEDFRYSRNGRIDIQDHKGVSIIYDVVLTDLQILENELTKLATIYINNGLYGRVQGNSSFYNDLLLKKERRADVKDATFINPIVDRAQLLLELYDAEVRYQNAKIEVVGCYMELFEHCKSSSDLKKVSQTIVNLLHVRPIFDLTAPYFTRDYALSTKAIKIQGELVADMASRSILQHRDWIERHLSKASPGPEEQDSTNGAGSMLRSGLPWKSASDDEEFVTMHHCAMSLKITEVVPAMALISKVQKQAKTLCQEFYSLLQVILAKNGVVATPSRSAAECVVWKGLNRVWKDLANHDFMLPLKGRRLIGGLENDNWLENPLLPEMILAEKYNPFDLQAEGGEKYIPNMIAPYTIFTDPHFQPHARDILCRVLKVIVMRNRLYFAWIETDFWKFIYEEQFPQMGLDKGEFSGRLGALNYDLPGMDNTVIEDDDFEDVEGKELNYDTGEAGEGSHATSNTYTWKCGPLAASELDENFNGMFDFANFKSIVKLIRPLNLHNMSRALKIQVLEKNWAMAEVEINSFLLHDNHRITMFEKPADAKVLDKSKKSRKPIRSNKKDRSTKQFEIDYKPFIVTCILIKKKQMRKAMLVEYAKESRTISKKEIKEVEREEELLVLKMKLSEWYYRNMKEIVFEECERAEYANLMIDFKVFAQSFSAGRVVFQNSKIQKNKDFVVGADTSSKAQKMNFDKTVDTQEVYTRSLEGAERISTLWYLPHVTETLLTFGTCDKTSKPNPDMTTRFYHNGHVYLKSIRVQKLLFEILRCVCVFASLLCDNGRFVKSVRDLREAEYIINVMNGIKKDLLHHGTPIDFEQAENHLTQKWEMWFMRTRLALLTVGYATMMKLMPKSSSFLFLQEEIMSQKKTMEKLRNPVPTWNLAEIKRRRTAQKYIPLASRYSFSKLDASAKECAETRIADLEDTLDSYAQATLLNFGENNDELNKNQMDYLLTRIRLFLLRKEYVNMTFFGAQIQNTEQLKEFMRLYKMRIIVAAIRLYHKQGSRGNAQTAALLNEEVVKCTADMELNRMSMSAFEKCQITTLLGELARQYTTHLMRNARHYFGLLSDERSGKLFKIYDYVEAQSTTGERQFAYTVQEKDYDIKTLMLQGFVDDLYKAHNIHVKERKTIATKNNVDIAVGTLAKPSSASKNKSEGVALDANRIFACSKELLAKAIMKLGLQLTKWGESHVIENEHMMSGMINKLTESLRTNEKIISNLQQERKEFQENLYHNVRLATAQAVSDIYADLASKSVEINDLRKSRKLEEKRVRNKITEEYDDLVTELVLDNHIIRNRFNEYRTNTVQEMLGIIAETKKEELVQLTESPEMPLELKQSALRTIEHDDIVKALKDELHEINMTLLKVRTMYTIKEQALRSNFAKKIKTLTEDNKKAEEKLWDSYRNAEAREAALRKIISKNNKDLLAAETRNEHLQKQLREEQNKNKQFATKNDRTLSARTRVENTAVNESKLPDALERLKYYERINVDKLLEDLKEKTHIIEDLVRKERSAATAAESVFHHTPKKLDLRPATAAPTFNKKTRSPVEDVLLKLAATTEENNMLKRKLAIFAVSPAAKKAIMNMALEPIQQVEKAPEVHRVDKGCQTFSLVPKDIPVFEPISPYVDESDAYEIEEWREDVEFTRPSTSDMDPSIDATHKLKQTMPSMSKGTSLRVSMTSGVRKMGSETYHPAPFSQLSSRVVSGRTSEAKRPYHTLGVGVQSDSIGEGHSMPIVGSRLEGDTSPRKNMRASASARDTVSRGASAAVTIPTGTSNSAKGKRESTNFGGQRGMFPSF